MVCAVVMFVSSVVYGQSMPSQSSPTMRLRAGFMPAPHLLSYLSVSQSCCASEFRTFVNVSVNVPLDAPLGTAKSTVTLAVSDPDVSVTDDGTTVHVEFGGPPLQVRLMVPWNPVVDDSVSIKTAMWPGGMLSVVGETAIVKSPTLRFAEAYCPFRHWSRSHCRWCWCIAQLPLRLQSR